MQQKEEIMKSLIGISSLGLLEDGEQTLTSWLLSLASPLFQGINL